MSGFTRVEVYSMLAAIPTGGLQGRCVSRGLNQISFGKNLYWNLISKNGKKLKKNIILKKLFL
jgi:hypothetical protein